MSIQGGGDGAVSYSDHDVHHVRHEIETQAGSGGDNVSDVSTFEFDITERGLDPDEIAELRAMRVTVGARADAVQGQDSRGAFQFDIDAGYNLSASEVIGQQIDQSEPLDPDGDGTDEFGTSAADTDEVGQVYTFGDAYMLGFDDDTNGNGSGTTLQSHTELLNMADLFGSGPYVDSADDFQSIINVEANNCIERLGVEVRYSLYYSVEQTEGGRSRFGR